MDIRDLPKEKDNSMMASTNSEGGYPTYPSSYNTYPSTGNYDPKDPRIADQRVITKDGRFNYNRSFNVSTLPQINGVPVIGDMLPADIGINVESMSTIEKIIRGNWSQYGVILPEPC